MNSMFMIVGLGGIGAVALLAFLVEANVIPEQHMRLFGFSIFGAMAVTIGALVLIDDDAEFEYGATSFKMKKKEAGGDGGGMSVVDDSGGGGGGDDAGDAAGGGDDMAGGGGGGGGGDGEGGGPVGFSATTDKASNQDCVECPAMVPVAAGSAAIGSFMDIIATDATSAPQVEVELPRSFAISQMEISRDQFKAFVVDTGYAAPTKCLIYGVWQAAPDYTSDDASIDGSRPATCLNYNNAVAYTKWLSKKAGRAYRLPSEAEWEYVAAANGGTAKFARGVPARHRGMVGEVAALFSGAAEWTSDCATDEIKIAGSDTTGVQLMANLASCGARITKGGSEVSSEEARQPGMRGRSDPRTAADDVGFRVLREAVE